MDYPPGQDKKKMPVVERWLLVEVRLYLFILKQTSIGTHYWSTIGRHLQSDTVFPSSFSHNEAKLSKKCLFSGGPKPRIPDSTKKIFPDSGFHGQHVPGFRNPDYLHGA